MSIENIFPITFRDPHELLKYSHYQTDWMHLFRKVINNFKFSLCSIAKFTVLLLFVKINVFCVLQDLLIVQPWRQWSSRTPWIHGKLTWAKCCRKQWIFWPISTNHSTNNLLNCWVIATTFTIYLDSNTNFRRSSVRYEGPTLSQTIAIISFLSSATKTSLLTIIHNSWRPFLSKHLTLYSSSM